MAKFKKGDKLRCINAEGLEKIIVGEIYTCLSYLINSAWPEGRATIDYNSAEISYRADRFELVNETKLIDYLNITRGVCGG